uniref:Uncharacterized protein n=1 Tax=Euplotes crassus TaxID=5936 RepID=A0A7S3P2T5_EUPCR|mmetsp:Transcript_9226/g.8857  ORF Transcript_9226/g.8857 Transcript_9226/m.8857 type:complete len:470 (+) Transcript_9226:121-1530(+)
MLIINNVIEDHISNVKKPYVPDFGIEEELHLTHKPASNYMNLTDEDQLGHSQKTAMKANSNWMLIADYVNKVPKNEKVFRVIQKINSMRDQAMILAAKDSQSKKRKNRNRLMSKDKKVPDISPPNAADKPSQDSPKELKENEGISWLKDWMIKNNAKAMKNLHKPRRVHLKDRSFAFSKSKSNLRTENATTKLNSTFAGRVYQNFSPDLRKPSPNQDLNDSFIKCVPVSPESSHKNIEESMDIKNIEKSIKKLSELKSLVNQTFMRKSWTRNFNDDRKASLSLIKMHLIPSKDKVIKENLSLDKSDNFGDASFPNPEFKRTNLTSQFSPSKRSHERDLLKGSSNELDLMKKYLNESERVLKIIVKKLSQLFKTMKQVLRFPRKNEIKESMKLYKQLCMPNKKNPVIPPEHEDNIKIFILQDLISLVRNKCTGQKLNFKIFMAANRLYSHPEVLEVIKQVKYFTQNSFSK